MSDDKELQSPSQPVVAEAVSYERDRVAKALDPALWSDDEETAHMAASPLQVCYARERSLIQADQFLVEYTAAHPQASPPPVQGEVAITREMFDFLCGSGPLEGYHFGEANPNERGAFWWRKRLLSLAHSQTDTQEGETERALRIGWWNDMRARGVSQDVAIRKINDALSAQAQTIGGGE